MTPSTERLTLLRDAWLALIEREQVVAGKRPALEAQLETWLELFFQVLSGQPYAEAEIGKLLAFHARELGSERRPTSASVLQVALLEDALREVVGQVEPAERALLLSLMRVVADAHALGANERVENQALGQFRSVLPVFRIHEHAVAALLLGPMERASIDGLLGRLLRECARSGAKEALLDVFGAEADNELLHRTLAALLELKEAEPLTLILSGLRDPEQTEQALRALGVDLSRVRFARDLGSYLDDTRGL